MAEANLILRVKSYITRCDREYAQNPKARGFYDQNSGTDNNNHDAVAYITTAEDATYLNKLGKQIGIARSQGTFFEEEQARANYHRQGLEYVKKRSDEYKTSSGNPEELHVKLETVRNKTGKIKGYNIIDMRFFPKTGPENPFMLTEWAKR